MLLSAVVADDDADVRSALCAALEADRRFAVIAFAASAEEVVAAVMRERPAAVLLDVRMPGGGVQAAREIRATGLLVAVVVVSAQVDAALVADMLEAGARGVLVKGRLGRDLPDLVARCCAGEVVLSTPAASAGLAIFAGRERELFRRQPEPHRGPAARRPLQPQPPAGYGGLVRHRHQAPVAGRGTHRLRV